MLEGLLFLRTSFERCEAAVWRNDLITLDLALIRLTSLVLLKQSAQSAWDGQKARNDGIIGN